MAKGKKEPTMVDITAPQTVEVEIREDGKVVWINVDGICRFRACQIRLLAVREHRNPKTIRDAERRLQDLEEEVASKVRSTKLDA